MFNTDIHHFLNQFDNPVLHWLMVAISAMGTIPFILTVVFGITFAIDFKKGLVVVNIVAWTVMLTFFLKHQIDYPRPVDVDQSIGMKYYEIDSDQPLVEQAIGFTDLFSNSLLERTRNDEFERYGFPSGHTSVQIALWMSLFFIFRKRWILYSGSILVLLTMFSRVFLGHHFLGDVVGGAILGSVVSLLLIFLVRKSSYLNELSHQFKSLSLLWIPVFLIPFAAFLPLWVLGSLIGLNAAAALIILQKNFPVFHVIVWKRVLAALFTLLLIFFAYYINRTTTFAQSVFIELLIISVINFALVLSSVFLSNRLNLIRFRLNLD